MEKRCEFCKALRPAVYCKSDAAHLCLSCDAKVHSANALSFRHPRTLVCDSCRFHPSIVRCFEHDMFMCHSCDTSHHVSLQHSRSVVSSYVGCPSAKDLAHLWGFHFKQGGTTTTKPKVVNDENERSQKSSYLILVQQILDLEKLQLSDSCSVNVEEQSGGGSAFRHEMLHNPVDEEVLSSPFPQLDNFTSGGDSIWQFHNNEIWHQNMQDLGVCDEVQCFDDVEIPDVDLTFRNFEEVFGSEQEDEKTYKLQPPLLDRLDRGCTSTSTSTVEETNNDVDQSQWESNHNRPMRPESSFCCSRITGESSGSDGKENAIARYKEKRVLRQEKQGHYTTPRSKSEFKKRGKSQVT